MPMVTSNKIIPAGAGLWLSERLMKSEMVHLYILDENRTGFIKVHSEENVIVNELNSNYNLGISGIIYHQQAGLLGPIKIWEINYPTYIKENPEYLSKVYPNKDLLEL